ncbi:MAG: DUF4433 domain-containing protein, partial [Dissulfuribacterales bacterium]
MLHHRRWDKRMERHELTELHYITPIANVPLILRLGILSHNRAKRVPHESVAMNEIQDRRARVTVPGGRKLHDYANLYICARNPMMYKRHAQHQSLCVLRITPNVINIAGAVITDGNASGDYVRFSAAPKGLAIVDRDWTFADDWRDPDQIQYFRKKAAKCAEVLVPDKVKPDYIAGVYVSC